MSLNKFIAVVGMLCLGACAPAKKPPVQLPANPIEEKKVGQKQLGRSAVIWKDYNCAERASVPFVLIEQQVIDPEVVGAGESFMHEFVYAACTDDRSGQIPGQLFRTISRRGRVIHSEPQSFEFKPGRWRVRAQIQVPPNTRAGKYELTAEFLADRTAGKHGRVKTKKTSGFDVSGEPQELPPGAAK